MQYFESDVPPGDGLCSDNSCPCPEVSIPRGTGYLYIEQDLVDFRRQYPQLKDARKAKVGQLDATRAALGIQFTAMYRLGPILVCEQGAKLRNLDLKVAAADAKHWWATGQVPLRATPLAGSTPQRTQSTSTVSPAVARARAAAKKKWWQFWK